MEIGRYFERLTGNIHNVRGQRGNLNSHTRSDLQLRAPSPGQQLLGPSLHMSVKRGFTKIQQFGTVVWAKSNILATCLLYMVDLVVFALLVPSDLPFWLFTQVTNAPDLCALPHRVFHGLGKGQTCLPHPFVQASVDCIPKDSRWLHEGIAVQGWAWKSDAHLLQLECVLTSYIMNVELLSALLFIQTRLDHLCGICKD